MLATSAEHLQQPEQRIKAHAPVAAAGIVRKGKAECGEQLSNYQQEISKGQANIDQLASKGVGTTALNATIAGADSAILAPLQRGLSTSPDATQLYAVFNSHCLENGCANGTNYPIST